MLLHGRYPRPPVPVQGCTSQTGRSTGLRDAQSRPGTAVTSRRPRAPPPLRQTGSPADDLHVSERGAFSSPRGANPRVSAGWRHRFEPTRFSIWFLFDARAPKLRHAADSHFFCAKGRRVRRFFEATCYSPPHHALRARAGGELIRRGEPSTRVAWIERSEIRDSPLRPLGLAKPSVACGRGNKGNG